ncbi:Methylmalonyl-CoA mutase, partial [Caldanaerovirga acetigignens]
MFDKESLKRIEKEKVRWENSTVKKVIEKTPERYERFHTGSNLEVNRLYTPLDVQGMDYVEDLGFPGEYPFTRGIQPTMYRGRLWTMRQYAGFGTA